MDKNLFFLGQQKLPRGNASLIKQILQKRSRHALSVENAIVTTILHDKTDDF